MEDVNKDQFYAIVGKRIAKARKAYKMTQADAATELNLSRVSIVNIEKGRQHVSLVQLWVLAKAYHVSIQSFLPQEKDLVKSNGTIFEVPTKELEKTTSKKSVIDLMTFIQENDL
jgi:transcriptional regulator with XRE-family HTH domain